MDDVIDTYLEAYEVHQHHECAGVITTVAEFFGELTERTAQ